LSPSLRHVEALLGVEGSKEFPEYGRLNGDSKSWRGEVLDVYIMGVRKIFEHKSFEKSFACPHKG
jgi:hypothetical protein